MFDSLIAEAQTLMATKSNSEVADATSAHVAQTDPETLANHLTNGTQRMSGDTLGSLAQSLLGSLAKNGTPDGAAPAAAAATEAPNQENVAALIGAASENPAALREGVVRFVQQNPQVLTQVPGLLEGVLGRLR